MLDRDSRERARPFSRGFRESRDSRDFRDSRGEKTLFVGTPFPGPKG